MKKRVLIGVIAALIVCAIGVAVYFITSQSQDKEPASTDNAECKEECSEINITRLRDTEHICDKDFEEKGGMKVTLQVSITDILKQLAPDCDNENFNEALRLTHKRLVEGAGNKDAIDIFVEEFTRLDPTVKLASIFQEVEDITYGMSNNETAKVLRNIVAQSMRNTCNIWAYRLDRSDVIAFEIDTMRLATGRFYIEVIKTKAPQKIHNIFTSKGSLEFWETYESAEVLQQLNYLNQVLGDATQTSPLFSMLNTSYTYGPVLGVALESDTATINAILGSDEVRALLPANLVTCWSAKSIDDAETYYQLVALRSSKNGKPALSGDIIDDANNDYYYDHAVVRITMTDEAARQWETITRNNINRSVGVVLDGVAYTWPVVNSVITCGSSEISGNFTPEEAKDLSIILRSGSLPAHIDIIDEEVILPTKR